MIRVLVLSNNPKETNGGGVDRYCRRLSELFSSDNDISVHYCSSLSGIYNKLLGAKLNDRQLQDVVLRENPDIIHLNGYTSRIIKQVTKLALKNGIKIVYTAHWHPFDTMNLGIMKKWYFNIFIRPYIHYFNAIVTINNDDTQFFRQFSEKVFQTPHWYQIADNSRYNYKIDRVSNRVLFVGRTNDSNKGFEYLLCLPKNKYDIHVVGEPKAVDRTDISFHQDISDENLTKLYLSSSVLVIPSRYEAFSYVALEALSLGTKIVISNRVRISDYLPHDSFVQFRYGQSKEFVDAVKKALDMKFNTTGILSIFNPQLAYKKYKELYLNAFDK